MAERKVLKEVCLLLILLQRTLICCECDFSFTKCIVLARGGGFNLLST